MPSRLVEADHPGRPTAGGAPAPAPIQIVLGVYLRGLRLSQQRTLAEAAAAARVRVNTSTVSRWERAESLIPLPALEALLRYYGVKRAHVQSLSDAFPSLQRGFRLLPPSRQHAENHEGRWDRWADVAGNEAVARYTALTRAASDVVFFTMGRIPPDYRTAEYRAAIIDTAPRHDEPSPGPRWFNWVPPVADARRTLLLDDTVLRRPVGDPRVMAAQLRHLLHLMAGPAGTSRADIRVVPSATQIGAHHLAGEVADLTVHGHRLLAGMDAMPWYTNRSRCAQAVHDSLRRAVDRAPGHRESYALIERAAEHWESQTEEDPQHHCDGCADSVAYSLGRSYRDPRSTPA
ncbi:Scr1 family TA system antitoxin-like transcriptional regulator [Streptomyces sp. DH12]|uniref:Scr1 family TA system antitoxin-like transcriptional regulator n=1 Tax=Streptomyces sp. DH12 TaxID=2857010 RepID=UPI001E2F4AFD|nr:Scr1 family TA system antitoxin-like transcriptional regulator [Streptomyces sp. DH12]